jgi:hypothetical protein
MDKICHKCVSSKYFCSRLCRNSTIINEPIKKYLIDDINPTIINNIEEFNINKYLDQSIIKNQIK